MARHNYNIYWPKRGLVRVPHRTGEHVLGVDGDDHLDRPRRGVRDGGLQEADFADEHRLPEFHVLEADHDAVPRSSRRGTLAVEEPCRDDVAGLLNELQNCATVDVASRVCVIWQHQPVLEELK